MDFKVGIIMGSDSDLPVMQEACKVLDELGVDYEEEIVSAHRTPDRMYEYAKNAHKNGISVIIAGAGGAAHLPGMVASLTHLPVIGVPVKSRSLSGVDSLHSIVQMPPGVPVATVAINGARNAGILAVSMIGIHSDEVRDNLIKFKKDMSDNIKEKSERLKEFGYEKYLEKGFDIK
ncbi:5-(carboxyamino)imidazole ribonucleotide mutase [Natranaerofaba carboxydovora]|uniref:5-(carboxyamino)imidazole ribonucleotide mutase n=1 Tax=Natranaerofaba carboxydovora TaxID=2742683 RepID=UPI001F130891|nr:5-(carboxyamino)imidazole ribonucleotide mutase [Natranaerofaba carboxydovora]UMZ74545.1 N5-carboxyaminoimidazole ribonucleotide mutase [Natranaerofaba carboxydovora]